MTGSELVTVTGVGSEGDPYIATVDCSTIQACVGGIIAGVGFNLDLFAAGGADGDVLTATGADSGLAQFLPA